MKTLCTQHLRARRLQAMTLPDLLIATTLFLMMIGGVISTNIFCMRQDELSNSKLGANDQSRLALDLLLGEIRACKGVQLGSGTSNSFTPLTNGVAQQANAIQIIPSTNLNIWIRYYFNTNNNNGELRRISSTDTNTTFLICSGLTNTMMFQVADFTGTNLLTTDPTNYTHNYVVSATFQFYQYQYPLTYVGPNQFYNYYRIGFKASRRAP
jgi:Tfp pilus assembly protein PilW